MYNQRYVIFKSDEKNDKTQSLLNPNKEACKIIRVILIVVDTKCMFLVHEVFFSNSHM